MEITKTKPAKKIFTKNAYGITEAADLLGVHPNTLYRLCRSGKMEAFRVGNAWRIPGTELEALRVPDPEHKEGRRPWKKKEGGAE